MSKVTDKLYIGNIHQATSQLWLREKHITHIVNCTQEINNVFPQDHIYSNLFLQDTPYQSLHSVLEKSYQFIENAIFNGGTVLVHCYAGISRSSSVIIYFLMKSKRWSYERSYNYLKQKHPRVNPNPGFVNQLSSLNKVQQYPFSQSTLDKSNRRSES